jgi:hypothetical protein
MDEGGLRGDDDVVLCVERCEMGGSEVVRSESSSSRDMDKARREISSE